jgi:hypothetical protein
MWEDKTGDVTGTYAIRNDIIWKWGLNKPAKIVENETVMPTKVIPTDITSVDGSYGKTHNGNPDQFLSFYLSACDYSGNTVALADEDLLGRINYYNYIEIDGVKLGTLWNYIEPGEKFFNVWSRANSFSTRWPGELNGQGEANVAARKAVQEIKVLAGCQFPSNDGTKLYEVKEDTAFYRLAEGYFVSEDYVLTNDNVTISNTFEVGEALEFYMFEITFDKWNSTRDSYDFNYFGGQFISMRQNILINGVSLYDINTTVDDSAYVYSTSP